MGVPLSRAWEVCRLLDEVDAARCDEDIERAFTLSAPTRPSPPGGGGQGGTANLDAIRSKLDPAAEERARLRRRARVARG